MIVRAVPVLRPDGSVREWIGVSLDISDRKQAERIVLQERDFSNALINSLPGIFYILDSTGLNLRWNKNLELITGFSSTEIARMRATDFVPPEDRDLVAQRVHKVFETGHADLELTLLCKSGKRIPYYCTGILVTIDRKPHLVGVGIDIAALKHAQQEIMRLNAELESRVAERTAQLHAANEELHSFIYTASHGLRSPIRAIVGFARAVLEDCGEHIADEGRVFLQRIMQAGDRMLQLIDDLLEYARIGQIALHLRPIPLNEFLTAFEDDSAFS